MPGSPLQGYTQKELATKINEKPQIINEYEQGKGIPNQQVHSALPSLAFLRTPPVSSPVATTLAFFYLGILQSFSFSG